MKRIYLLEGPDGCGKSVLATDLADRLKPAILTRHGPYPGDREVWRKYLAAMLPAWADLADVVLDRSWLSEPIYGAAYRGGANRITVAQRRMLERVALARGAVTITCRVPWKDCRENFRRRKAEGGEMLDDAKQLRAVYDGYVELETALDRADVPRCQYSYLSGKTSDQLLALTELVTPPENLGPGIGRWAPGKVALLVGERPGGFGGQAHLPFVSLRADGCSAWLAEQLEAGGIPESQLYWVNAFDGGTAKQSFVTELDATFISRLAPRVIVALGTDAVNWLGVHGYKLKDIVAVDHPQHWKRFHSKRSYPLIKELRSCLR